MNSFRIAMTGILYEVWGAKVAEGFFHGFSGWLIFLVAIGIMLGEMWILNRIGPKRIEVKGRIEEDSKFKIQDSENKIFKTSTPRLKTFSLKSILEPPQFIVTIIILVTTLLLSNVIEFREKIPIKKALEKFPLEVNEWVGKYDTMEQRFIDELDLSDYVIVDYQNKSGKQVNFYVAYYESQRKGESIHSPETCLPGSGWEFHQAGTTIIPLSPKSPNSSYEIDKSTGRKYIKVNRAFMAKPGIRQLVYFWFPQRGRNLTNAYELKIYTFWDALTKQRTDGALVRIITPVYKDEDLKDAEFRLLGFTRDVLPILSQFLPGK
jgi:exosortase D (VPLPA-CTERM-specific)